VGEARDVSYWSAAVVSGDGMGGFDDSDNIKCTRRRLRRFTKRVDASLGRMACSKQSMSQPAGDLCVIVMSDVPEF